MSRSKKRSSSEGTDAEFEDGLKQAVRRVFSGLGDREIHCLVRGELPWDSLAHVALIDSLEREFKISVDVRFSINVRDWASLLSEFRRLHRT